MRPMRAAKSAAPVASEIVDGTYEGFASHLKASRAQVSARRSAASAMARDRDAAKGSGARVGRAASSDALASAVRAAAGGLLPTTGSASAPQLPGMPGVLVPSGGAIAKLQKVQEITRRQYGASNPLLDEAERVDEERVPVVDGGAVGGVRDVQADRDRLRAKHASEVANFRKSVRGVARGRGGARFEMPSVTAQSTALDN